MPIKTLVNKNPDMPRLGKIRKGGEKVSDRKPGPDLDYFRITSDRPGLEDNLRKLYGDEPRELRGILPYHLPEQIFDPWMKEYGTAGLKRQCDGENQVLWLPEGTSQYRGVGVGDAPLPCLAATKGCKCQRNAALKIVLPEVFAIACGYFELVTSSKHDILSIDGSLNYIFGLRQSLLGVPVIVRRSIETKSYPNPSGTRSTKEYSLIKLEVDPTWLQRQFANQLAEMMGTEPIAALPAAPMTYASVTERINTPAIAPTPITPALPVTKPTPQWAIDLRSARERLGLAQEQVKQIAADNGIELKNVNDRALAQLIELMEIEAENSVMDAEVVELPLADQYSAQIKANADNAQALQTIKVQIEMQAATLSPAVAGGLTDRVNNALRKFEVAA